MNLDNPKETAPSIASAKTTVETRPTHPNYRIHRSASPHV
ncbi:MAG: hypothetical protein ACI901_002065, partial [Octadecabacter sp.]